MLQTYVEISAAGERHSTPFGAGIVDCAIKVDILRPIFVAMIGDATTIEFHLNDIDQIL